MSVRMPIRKRCYKRKDGTRFFTWYFDKVYEGIGRVRRPLPTARTQAQAEDAARQLITEIHEGRYRPTSKDDMTVAEFFEKNYLPWARETKLSWRMDVHRSKAVLAFFGNKKLIEVNPFLIETYKLQRQKTPIVIKRKDRSNPANPVWVVNREKPRSAGAVNRELALLSAIFRQAVEEKKIAANPVREVNHLPGEQGRERYLLPEEEERLTAVLVGRKAHLHDIVILDINTGLRESELLNLKAENVDFHRDVIILREREGFTIKDRKARTIPLNSTARELLRRLVEEARAEGDEYLFTNPATGTKYTSIKTAWANACRCAGIRDLRFHDLRHTFGTRAADQGVPLRAIGKVMGHSSTATTERYAHATDEAMRRTVEAVDTRGTHMARKTKVI